MPSIDEGAAIFDALDADRSGDIDEGEATAFAQSLIAAADLQVKLRHGPETVACRVSDAGEGTLDLLLERPDPGIAPGQHAVLYDGETCLGGGIIA